MSPKLPRIAASELMRALRRDGWEQVQRPHYQFTIILHPDVEEGGYSVTVPSLPGCVTQGETLEEAIAMAKDAIRLYIDSLIADGEPIPEEREHPQAIVIEVAA